MAVELFGFEIRRKDEEEEKKKLKSFVEPNDADGAFSVNTQVPGSGGAMSTFLDLEGAAKSEAELVNRYRTMLQQPEVQQAVDDIVNEAIHVSDDRKVVECNTDDVDLSNSIKNKIRDEFENVLTLLNFSNNGYDIFMKWYVDGRINYHVIIDEEKPKDGIKELRYIDPRKIRKVREYDQVRVGEGANSTYIRKLKNEYYLYVDRGFIQDNTKYDVKMGQFSGNVNGLRIAKDSVVNCNSGLLNEKNTLILSHLHKAYKPLNQLRMMEDASVVYRISRAPERRVFYIDVGNLPKAKAEQYLRSMMVNHKNKLVYDATTGDVKDGRRHMSMTDDFWLPRREGGKGTEIDTLPGGQNLGEMEDILYFQKRLYKSLNVPITRMEAENGFSLGRASEITRDEVKFSKFVQRLRIRFSIIFDKILEKQLVMKGIITPEEWAQIEDKLRYDFMFDNHWEELKQSEILRERINTLRDMDEYVGVYYSKEYVWKDVLRLTEDEIKEMKKQIDKEKDEGDIDGDGENDAYGMGDDTDSDDHFDRKPTPPANSVEKPPETGQETESRQLINSSANNK